MDGVILLVESVLAIMVPQTWGIPQTEYEHLPKRFSSVKFYARAIVALARSAGQQSLSS
jgi:hypothetical protein